MEQQGFEELRKSVLDRMIQYNTCESSQNEVLQSNNDGILFSLLHKYWQRHIGKCRLLLNSSCYRCKKHRLRL